MTELVNRIIAWVVMLLFLLLIVCIKSGSRFSENGVSNTAPQPIHGRFLCS